MASGAFIHLGFNLFEGAPEANTQCPRIAPKGTQVTGYSDPEGAWPHFSWVSGKASVGALPKLGRNPEWEFRIEQK